MHHLKTCVIYCIASLSPMGTWEVGFCSLEEWLPIIVGNCMLKECLYSVTGGKHTTYSSQCSLKGNWMWNLWQGDMILSLWILTEIYPPRIAATINLKGSRASAFPLTGRHPSSEWWEMFVHVIYLGWVAGWVSKSWGICKRPCGPLHCQGKACQLVSSWSEWQLLLIWIDTFYGYQYFVMSQAAQYWTSPSCVLVKGIALWETHWFL